VVILDLEEHCAHILEQGGFVESIRAEKAVEDARAQHFKAVKLRTRDEATSEIQEKQQNSQHRHARSWGELRQWERTLELKLEEERRQLLSRHEKERQAHDFAWQVEPKQRRWNRASQKLRNMRVQQTHLLNGRNFDDADQVRRIADTVAMAEAKENHFQLGAAYYQSRKLLDAKHEGEIDTFNRAAEVRRGELKYQRACWTKRFSNRDQALEQQLELAQDAERLWILKHRHEGDQVVKAVGASRAVARFHKTINVAEFNTLQLPNLPALTGRHRVRTAREDPPEILLKP
jgi:hypothetical protein